MSVTNGSERLLGQRSKRGLARKGGIMGGPAHPGALVAPAVNHCFHNSGRAFAAAAVAAAG